MAVNVERDRRRSVPKKRRSERLEGPRRHLHRAGVQPPEAVGTGLIEPEVTLRPHDDVLDEHWTVFLTVHWHDAELAGKRHASDAEVVSIDEPDAVLWTTSERTR